MAEGFLRAPESAIKGSSSLITPEQQETTTVSVQRKYTVGISAKIGKNFESSKWSGFASLGLLISRFSIKTNLVLYKRFNNSIEGGGFFQISKRTGHCARSGPDLE